MHLKAEAFKQYNQAAVLDKLIPVLPQMMQAIAEPLGKVDRITMLSTGGNAEVGVNKLMVDIAKVVAQAPAMVETLTGMKMQELITAIPALREHLPPEITEEKQG
jgi:flotillin